MIAQLLQACVSLHCVRLELTQLNDVCTVLYVHRVRFRIALVVEITCTLSVSSRFDSGDTCTSRR